jgi:dihydroneopterin aldolase
MLVTVTGPDEASIALRIRADMIAAADRVRECLAVIGGRHPVCTTIDDAMLEPHLLAEAVQLHTSLGATYIKIGFSTARDEMAKINALSDAARQVKLIGVFFADQSIDMSLLATLARGGFLGAMLDIKEGTAGSLLTQCDIARVHEFVHACHGAGLLAGLSGGLELPDVPRLLPVSPDILGFSAAALDAPGIEAIRAMIPPHGTLHDSALRRPSPRAQIEAPVDRVLVNGMVLPVLIGAYARERQTPQRVRFTVEACVRPANRTATDMRDVFSYDLITDGIRLIVGAGHVPLVETLAERVADMVLSYAPVTKVMVRVEKLDTGAGTVGIEIERAQPSQTSARPSLLSGG